MILDFFDSFQIAASNPFVPAVPLLETNDDDEPDNNQIIPSTCPLGQEHRGFLSRVSFCEPENLSLICPVSHPYCLHSNIWGATVCCSSNVASQSIV